MRKSRRRTEIKLGFFTFGILEQGGGFENFVIETAKNITERSPRVTVTIITASPKLTEKLQHILTVYFLKRHGIKNIYRESTEVVTQKLGRSRYVHFNNFSELITSLNSNDVIYVKNEILELLILKLLKRRLKPPLIMGVHTAIYYPIPQSFSDKLHNLLYCGSFYKWLIRDIRDIKVNTQDNKNYLKFRFGLNNVHVVHCAFDVIPGRQVKNNDHGFRILFVGRITKQKGIDVLIQIIDRLHEKSDFSNFIFKIAGGGQKDYVDKLEDVTIKYKNVQYLGHVENNKISSLYDWTDITIIPSYWETLSWVAAETAIAGKIAICSDIPGPREVIVDNLTGYLVPLGTESFVKKIIELSALKREDPHTFYDIGMNAQNKIIRDFNPDKIYDQFCKCLLNNYHPITK